MMLQLLYKPVWVNCTHIKCTCVWYCRAPTRLEIAGWGSEPAGGEGHGGCYDNFVMVFDRYAKPLKVIPLHAYSVHSCTCSNLHTLYMYIHCSTRGPVVLLRTEFGVLSRGKMGPTELVSEYLRCGKTNQVHVCYVHVCDNDGCPVILLLLLYRIFLALFLQTACEI